MRIELKPVSFGAIGLAITYDNRIAIESGVGDSKINRPRIFLSIAEAKLFRDKLDIGIKTLEEKEKQIDGH